MQPIKPSKKQVTRVHSLILRMKPKPIRDITSHLSIRLHLLFCLIILFSLGADRSHAAHTQVFVIPVSGEIEPAMAAFIKRAITDATRAPNSLIILELDTFGGRVDAALNIVDTMVNISQHRTIAFVKSKAISAGALVALSCNDLAMRPSTTIGDCAPITYANDGPKMMGEKFQSPLRAKFRSLARRNNYPPILAASMVSAEKEVYAIVNQGQTRYLDSKEYDNLPQSEKNLIKIKKTVVAKGELLTMDDREALSLGFSRMTANSVEEVLHQFEIDDFQITRLDPSWSESVGRFIAHLSPILLMIGLAALYVEIKAPGFGLPGIIGIITLGLVFLNQYLVGLANYTELLFVTLGIVLLAMEIFVLPGFGFAGVAGFLCLGISMVLSFQDFVIPDPALPWQGEILVTNLILVFAAIVAAFCLTLFFLSYVLPKLGRVFEGPYLNATLAASHADSVEAKRVAIGDTGTALTLLRPAGKVRIDSSTIDAISEGEFLEKNTPVRVREIRGNQVIVTRCAP
ncbi:MAG: NfeD family protein [Desulfobulbaceae bacterium]|nr:NfeD family protein [Desulfobulbaceae bacterium]